MHRTLIFCISLSAAASVATAANQISWIANGGADSSTCGARTAPCATLQRAHDNTAPGGIVKAVNAGDYGELTIHKAITIDGSGLAEVTVSSFGATGIIVAAGPSQPVTIRALSINAGGVSTRGIYAAGQGNVYLEDVVISGGSSSSGVLMTTTSLTATRLTVTGATFGLYSLGSVSIRDSVFQGNGTGIHVAGASSGPGGTAMIERCELSFNSTGLLVDGSIGPATAHISDSVITGNTTGFSQTNGGTIISFRTNMLAGNGTDGTPALSTSLK